MLAVRNCSKMKLDAKVVVVTGGSQGLGKTLATSLVEEGAVVAIIGRDKLKLEQAQRSIGDSVLDFACDISDPASVRKTFTAIAQKMGRIDALINNAAVYPPFMFEVATDEQIQTVINTNLLGAIYCCREVLPYLKKTSGDIVNISSESVRFYPPLVSVYAASKSALETFSQCLRGEVAGDGVRVSVLRCGSIVSAAAPTLDEKAVAELIKVYEKSGFLAQTGAGMEGSTVAASILHLLSLPRDANIDLMEIRSRN